MTIYPRLIFPHDKRANYATDAIKALVVQTWIWQAVGVDKFPNVPLRPEKYRLVENLFGCVPVND
jgi:hypothetical protein